MSNDHLLLDRHCPTYDFTRLEFQLIAAPAPAAMEAMRSLDLAAIRSPLSDLATAIRSLPERLRHESPQEPRSMRLGDLFDSPEESELPGWVGLDEVRTRELAFGAIGKFWQPQISWRSVKAEEFASFSEPGWGKIVAGIVSHPYGAQSSILSYEARTVLYDDDSRRRFRRYWRLVSPFAGVVMRSALKAVAESQHSTTASSGGRKSG
ncbi:MAG: hypothetical protein ACR2NL_08425 [Acidimicrobiia bacterium]